MSKPCYKVVLKNQILYLSSSNTENINELSLTDSVKIKRAKETINKLKNLMEISIKNSKEFKQFQSKIKKENDRIETILSKL